MAESDDQNAIPRYRQAMVRYEQSVIEQNEYREPCLALLIVDKLFLLDSDSRLGDLLIVVLMMGLGVLILSGFYLWGWMDPGVWRGVCNWFIFALCSSKFFCGVDCGGPVIAMTMGLNVALLLEVYPWALEVVREKAG